MSATLIQCPSKIHEQNFCAKKKHLINESHFEIQKNFFPNIYFLR